tara:strand:+ start:8802 stop:9611 length:810 start_codon:yes stop_codon:yes gene_type:complete
MEYYKTPNLSLKKGDQGSEVKELQEDLNKLGYNVGKADSDFGAKTEKAVKAFQSAHLVTGTVNPETALAIHSKADKTAAPKALPEIPFIASPNLSNRKGREINLVVIHFTASGSLDGSVRWFENPTANASAHYIIDKDGKIVQMVKEKEKAWHAGKSQWGGVKNCNDFSIGIEVVNWGILKKRDGKFYCWPNEYKTEYSGPSPEEVEDQYWEPYADKQYDVLALLTGGIIRRHNISLDRIVGHSDIAPGRKKDPGPLFNWDRFKNTLSV